METRKLIALNYRPRRSLQATVSQQLRMLLRALSSKRARRVSTMVVVIFCGVGYISNIASMRRAENATARIMAEKNDDRLLYRDFWVADSTSDDIFKRAGCPASSQNPFGPPWDRLEIHKAQIYVPWLCAVHHAEWSGQKKIDGGDIYFCFFGYIWRVQGQRRETLATH